MQLKNTILILINPKAKKKRVNKIADEIISFLSSKEIFYERFIETWPDEINFYKEVWLIGGDGTLNYFLNFYQDITIPISIFKGGTGNDFSWKLYGDISIKQQVEKILNAVPKNVDAGICNKKNFIVGIGIGFDGEVLRSINTIRFLGGHFGYLWIVIKKIFSFKEYKYHISYADRNLSEKFLLVMITNSSRTGGGFMVAPNAKIDDGKLDMILCKPLSVFKRLQYLPIIQNGKHLNKNFIVYQNIESVTITCKQEVFAHMDGELIAAKTFTISIHPHRFLFKY